MKKLILYYFLLITSCTASFSQATIQQLLNNGTNDEKINIVILSEGYRESELTKFITDANKVLDYIFKQVPFSDNKTYFNAFAISVASNESGSDKPASNIYKDTYFNSTYNCNNIQRLICLEGDGMSKAFRHLVELIPDYDIPVMIVNDNEYGGSGGSLSIISNNPSSITAAVHEIGHSFASLADEYESAYPGYNPYEKPNVTAITSRDSIKWKSFILQTTPIPTPETSQYSGVIGLFEGAMYQTKGWYRPKMNCMMRSLGIPFCEVCSTEVLKKVRSLIEPPRISINFVTSKNLCPGNSFVVSVLATKAFNKPNEYTVELSDGDGIFSSPVIIGRVATYYGASITSVIPVSIIPSDNYQIRVKSSNPFSYSDTVEIKVNTIPSKPLITRNINTLISSADSGNIWLFNKSEIPLEKSKHLNADKSGVYNVKSIINNCASELSDDFSFTYTSLKDETEKYSVFFKGNNLYIELSNGGKADIQIFNYMGIQAVTLIDNEYGAGVNLIDLSKYNLSSGIYLSTIRIRKEISTIKFQVVE